MNEEPVEILLIEDNPNDMELTLHSLNRYHVANHIQVARDGQEGLDLIFGPGGYVERGLHLGPQVILLDLKLPKIDGIEVLKRLKGDPRTRTIPVVVLTSSQETPDVEACYALGVNSYIVKPVDFVRFAEAVRQLGMYWLLLNKSCG